MSTIVKAASAGKRKIILLLSALVGLVVADGVMTNVLVGKGTAWEANPFLEPIVGKAGFMIIKIVGALLCALILWDVHRALSAGGDNRGMDCGHRLRGNCSLERGAYPSSVISVISLFSGRRQSGISSGITSTNWTSRGSL